MSRFQFQAHQEQHQHHPQFGKMQDRLRFTDQGEPQRANGNSGYQITQNATQPDSLENGQQNKGGRQ